MRITKRREKNHTRKRKLMKYEDYNETQRDTLKENDQKEKLNKKKIEKKKERYITHSEKEREN